MELCVKRFNELSCEELYEILRLRVSVFVVEQSCPYMELDNMDQTALHVYFRDDSGIQAYLRIMDKNSLRPYVSVGRVIAVKRRCGMGSKLLAEAIRLAKESFKADKIYVEAQTYATGLYAKQGFVPISDEFLEDGIPHIKMLLDCSDTGII